MFALVDDLPLTLAHVVSCPIFYPTKTELGSILTQVCHLSPLLGTLFIGFPGSGRRLVFGGFWPHSPVIFMS